MPALVAEVQEACGITASSAKASTHSLLCLFMPQMLTKQGKSRRSAHSPAGTGIHPLRLAGCFDARGNIEEGSTGTGSPQQQQGIRSVRRLPGAAAGDFTCHIETSVTPPRLDSLLSSAA